MCRNETHHDAIRELGRARSQLTAEHREAAEKLRQEVVASLTHLLAGNALQEDRDKVGVIRVV